MVNSEGNIRNLYYNNPHLDYQNKLVKNDCIGWYVDDLYFKTY